MEKFKKYFPIFYIIFLISAFFYVRKVLNTDRLSVQTKTEEKSSEEVKPVDVTLKINGLKNQRIYEKRLENIKTFDDLLELLVKEDVFIYEKTEYTYGTQYDRINNETAPEGYIWKVFDDDKEITLNTKGYKLTDKHSYTLLLTKQ